MNGVVDYRTALEIASHEAIIRQAYKDSVDVWTWSIGVTSRSGHGVERYIGKPQSLEHCLAVYAWLLETRYAPAVRRAFAGRELTQPQFAAALGFHYNTGQIGSASWVKMWKAGEVTGARRSFMSWNKVTRNGKKVVSKGLTSRRKKECALFFDGGWSNDGTVTEFTRLTSRNTPDFRSGRKINIERELKAAFADAAKPPSPNDTGTSERSSAKPAGWLTALVQLITAIFGKKKGHLDG